LFLDLLSLLTQATQGVSSYLMEDLSMLCSVYLLPEVLQELVLVSEELVSTLISTLAELVLDTELVLEVPDTELVLEVPDTELVLELLLQLAKDCHLLMAQELEVSTLISTLEVPEVQDLMVLADLQDPLDLMVPVDLLDPLDPLDLMLPVDLLDPLDLMAQADLQDLMAQVDLQLILTFMLLDLVDPRDHMDLVDLVDLLASPALLDSFLHLVELNHSSHPVDQDTCHLILAIRLEIHLLTTMIPQASCHTQPSHRCLLQVSCLKASQVELDHSLYSSCSTLTDLSNLPTPQ